ncbi:hypothetical protein [Streptomyces sp. NPDC001401]|uniref:hypothetical protein n=1 Tax=Streptomyces sp. NPDC001401 TaxID=3364570 RepID=UPI003686CDA5
MEFGFVGVDSLGRHYDQPPHPHLGPAVEHTGQELVGMLARAAVVVELLGDEGERSLSVLATPGMPEWDALGLCRYGVLSIEGRAAAFFIEDAERSTVRRCPRRSST